MKLSTEALEVLHDAGKRSLQGLPPPLASTEAIMNVGAAAIPWLLSQRQWQCNQCERPATTLNFAMGLGITDTGAVCVANASPCLPACGNNNSCFRRNTDAGGKMRREMRSQPARTEANDPSSILPGIACARAGEIQVCIRCHKTNLYQGDKTTKFKSCSRCLRVRYWCVNCYGCPSTL